MFLQPKDKKSDDNTQDPRKHPKPGYDEKQPSEQFPVNSNVPAKKIKK